MGVTLAGSDEFAAALKALDAAADAGARAGVVAGGRKLVSLTRKNLKGDPRWSRRGAGLTGPAVDTGRRPVHVPRGGGPGVLTGNLVKGVHSVRPRKALGAWEGKVSAMGYERNLYAPRTEARYPFLEPALHEFEPLAEKIFEQAFALRIGKI